MIRFAAAVAFLVAVTMTGAGRAGDATYEILSFKELRGWATDDLDRALDVYKETCADMSGAAWQSLCALATNQKKARTFFELFFRPVLIDSGDPALFTGYFEPELSGSRHRTERFRYPIYRLPPEMPRGRAWLTREEIEQSGVLTGRGLEIAWIDDPVEVFFLQIQGSGRIRLDDGTAIRVGYAGNNGRTYRSVGQELVRRGVYSEHQVSATVIRNWVRRNPVSGAQLLRHNPSYVFFREINSVPASMGPLGAMNRSITAMRSIAVDPGYVPLGAPVWIDKGGDRPLRRLMIAQDTGSAIRGAQRADIFFGTGRAAGRRAGEIRDPGRMVVLMPISLALALVSDGPG